MRSNDLALDLRRLRTQYDEIDLATGLRELQRKFGCKGP